MGKTLFLVVSVRVFLEDISIWISRMDKDLPTPVWVGSSRASVEQKGGGKVNSLSSETGTYIFSCHTTLEFKVLGLSDSWTYTSNP